VQEAGVVARGVALSSSQVFAQLYQPLQTETSHTLTCADFDDAAFSHQYAAALAMALRTSVEQPVVGANVTAVVIPVFTSRSHWVRIFCPSHQAARAPW
jgi:hypothetical protein